MPDLFTSLLILALSVGIAYLINWVPNVMIANPYASMIKALSPEETEAKGLYELQGKMYEKRKALKLALASALILMMVFIRLNPVLRASLTLASAGTIITTLILHLGYNIIYQDDNESYMVWSVVGSIIALVYAAINYDKTLMLL